MNIVLYMYLSHSLILSLHMSPQHTDSKVSQGSAVTLGLPMPALPFGIGNSLQGANLGNVTRLASLASNIGRFSSTSSSVSNPSGGK
jgi:hypothetical protein